MLAKILKQFCKSYLPIITKTFNESITEGTFLSGLKLAQITPVFKKLDCMNKESYKPSNILNNDNNNNNNNNSNNNKVIVIIITIIINVRNACVLCTTTENQLLKSLSKDQQSSKILDVSN